MAEGSRYFELCRGASRKFWEITLEGARYVIRFGRIGTAGQTVEKSFPSHAAAKAAANGLMAKKHRKGYVYVPDQGAVATKSPSSGISSYLRSVQEIYRAHGQSLRLRKPARATALRTLERPLGTSLDQGLSAAWTAADGTEAHAALFCRPGYLTGYAFVSIEEALELRETMRRRAATYSGYVEPEPRDRRLAQGWFHPGWLPFARSEGGLLLFQDYAPSEHGRVGQIAAFTHDPDQIELVAPAFDVFLQQSLKTFRDEAEEVLGLF